MRRVAFLVAAVASLVAGELRAQPAAYEAGVELEAAGRWREALASYRTALADAETAAAAQAAIDRLDPRVPELTVVPGEGAEAARVYLDGNELAELGTLELDRGKHTLEAFVAGERRMGLVVELAEAERRSVVVELLPPLPPPAPVVPSPPPLRLPPADDGAALRTGGYVGIAFGGAFLAAGMAALAVREFYLAQAEQACVEDACPVTTEEDHDRADTATGLMIGALSLSAASFAVGITLLVVAPDRPVHVRATPSGVTVSGAF
jgi:hypothetical protein